ncbi:carboxyvinyl-carboxyphosphonate phosphorylmutase [Aequitasia blattaphilus]|uniref:Isocitrate lyase/PEP mutase family protein n=1 Tax=Aequitasia blattaphilus TaxID=2949332 RepID=A0ABT1E7P2_9FIRM|nr:isocitrate lyase/PEP mutase family protein [Aequitasia blattaphilus]MCP1101843.1 isocitrate lyase/PEP mutase family protein [Aequitasia blattaphilus]MCR8614483.1 isocitrate lyase/PEP mutase family protein [Aequitasia blattaphilus]
MNGPKRMRELFATKNTIVAPGAHDMLTGRIISTLGFDAVYMTGYGQSASHLGKPDVGLMTMSEMVARAANLVECTEIPVIADADTGFGNAVNVMRTVREYEKAGVAVIQLEDQVMPKKCGHMTGREVIPTEEMIGKIKAAVDTRVNPDFMIMARTDAVTTQGIGAALERAHKYKEAGADIIFVESPESKKEMQRINEELPGCLTLANMVEGGRTPQLTNKELSDLGFNLIIYPTASVYVQTKAMLDFWKAAREEDTTASLLDSMVPFSDFNEIVGLTKIREIEEKYATGRSILNV